MEVSQAIQQRRSVKQYEQRPIPMDLLRQVVEAAYLAPTGANWRSREVLVVTDRDQLQQLGNTHGACKWLSGAPAGVVLLGDPAASRYWVEDCSVAATFAWLRAMELGLGCAWAAMYQSDNPEESARREGFCRQVLGVPEHLRVVAVMGLGYPAESPEPKPRRDYNSVVHWGGYGQHLSQ